MVFKDIMAIRIEDMGSHVHVMVERDDKTREYNTNSQFAIMALYKIIGGMVDNGDAITRGNVTAIL